MKINDITLLKEVFKADIVKIWVIALHWIRIVSNHFGAKAFEQFDSNLPNMTGAHHANGLLTEFLTDEGARFFIIARL